METCESNCSLSVNNARVYRAREKRLLTDELNALSNNAWFLGLSAAMRHDMLRALRVTTYGANEQIFYAAAPVHGWMVCVSGAVRLSIPSSTGRHLTLRFLRPGQWFGAVPTESGSVHVHDASAKGETRVGELCADDILYLSKTHSDFHLALLKWESFRLQSVFRLLEAHATEDLGMRMARQLHRLAKDHGVPNGGTEMRITLHLRQSDLADLAGCSRQRANEQIGKFMQNGLIRHENGVYVIKDPLALERMFTTF